MSFKHLPADAIKAFVRSECKFTKFAYQPKTSVQMESKLSPTKVLFFEDPIKSIEHATTNVFLVLTEANDLFMYTSDASSCAFQLQYRFEALSFCYTQSDFHESRKWLSKLAVVHESKLERQVIIFTF